MCAKHKVKRCILTSDIVTVIHDSWKSKTEEGKKYTEAHWSEVEYLSDPAQRYAKHKTLAEKRAWEF